MVSVVEALETPETTVPFESLRERHPTHKKKGVLQYAPTCYIGTDETSAPALTEVSGFLCYSLVVMLGG